MNEEPKGIFRRMLSNAWNEPRHFFFWLALLCPFLFALVVLTATTGIMLPFGHWIALAAALGFVLGVPAFALSWIPTFRPRFTWLLQRKLLALACVGTVIGLFYAVENWRGRNAWNNFRHEWEARGVRFDAENNPPPAVPDEQNFFMTPPWEFLRFSKSNNIVVWKYDEATRDKSMLDRSGPRGSAEPSAGSLLAATRIDLRAWQEFYRGSNNLFAAEGGTFTNYFPVAPRPQTPAQDILRALTRSEPTLQQLRDAARRPQARFWINYEDGFNGLLPHLAKTKGNAQYLRLRAAALLADGQTEAALADTMLAFRLTDTLRNEPVLISQLVRIAAIHINLLAVWDGLADHRWSEAQLEALERELAQEDFLADYQTAMSGERACATWTMDLLQRTRNLDSVGGLSEEGGRSSTGEQLEETVGLIIGRLAPSGWFDQNKLSLGRMHVEVIRPLVDQEKQIVAPANSRRTSAVIESRSSHRSPYNLFTGMLIPALDKACKKFAIAQTYVNLARVACALERYRLAHDGYPETLGALVPQYIDKLPHDIINGQPLKYRRAPGGSFVLYSVGWNETDDGGTVVLRDAKNATAVDQDKGDWVWRYPAL